MPRFRPLALLMLAAAALLPVGCLKSNNEGKIHGKWKLVDSPEFNTAEGRAAVQAGLYVVVDFKPDNSMTIALQSDQPGVMDLLRQGMPGGKTIFTAKYKLMGGDNVQLSDIEKDALQFIKPGRVMVNITGDQMSITTATGVEKYTRLSAPALNAK
jgi:hypothetical protein